MWTNANRKKMDKIRQYGQIEQIRNKRKRHKKLIDTYNISARQ